MANGIVHYIPGKIQGSRKIVEMYRYQKHNIFYDLHIRFPIKVLVTFLQSIVGVRYKWIAFTMSQHTQHMHSETIVWLMANGIIHYIPDKIQGSRKIVEMYRYQKHNIFYDLHIRFPIKVLMMFLQSIVGVRYKWIAFTMSQHTQHMHSETIVWLMANGIIHYIPGKIQGSRKIVEMYRYQKHNIFYDLHIRFPIKVLMMFLQSIVGVRYKWIAFTMSQHMQHMHSETIVWLMANGMIHYIPGKIQGSRKIVEMYRYQKHNIFHDLHIRFPIKVLVTFLQSIVGVRYKWITFTMSQHIQHMHSETIVWLMANGIIHYIPDKIQGSRKTVEIYHWRRHLIISNYCPRLP